LAGNKREKDTRATCYTGDVQRRERLEINRYREKKADLRNFATILVTERQNSMKTPITQIIHKLVETCTIEPGIVADEHKASTRGETDGESRRKKK